MEAAISIIIMVGVVSALISAVKSRKESDRMKSFEVVELMVRFRFPNGYTVRVWMAVVQDVGQEGVDRRRVIDVCKKHEAKWLETMGSFDKEQLIDELTDLTRINAVELVNSHGDGHVYYPEWP